MNLGSEAVLPAVVAPPDAAVEDEAVISRCQRGDKQAFGLLVRKYMRRGYYAALGFVHSHDAALDLSQEAFVRAFRAIKKFEPGRSFFTWYYQILRNLCLNAIRDRNRRARAFSEVGETLLAAVPDGTRNAAEALERKELQEAVWRGLNALRPPEREIIVLKDFQGYSYKEIAELLGCPIGTVMSRLYNARQALRKQLEGYLDGI